MKIEISILIGAIGMLVAILTIISMYRKTTQSESAIVARTEEKLNYITRVVDDIRSDQKDQATKIESIVDRLIHVETWIEHTEKRTIETMKEMKK